MCGISLCIEGLPPVVDCPPFRRVPCAESGGAAPSGMMPPLCCVAPQRRGAETEGRASSVSPIDHQALATSIARRGPDHTMTHSCSPCGGGMRMTVQGSVLSLRRERTASMEPNSIVPQPLFAAVASSDTHRSSAPLHPAAPTSSSSSSPTSSSSWLLWNGEVFGGATVPVQVDECDTRRVLAQLHEIEATSSIIAVGTDTSGDHTVLTNDDAQHDETSAITERFVSRARHVLEGIEGPFAVIYYAASLGVVLYGRDPVGRRSLVVHRSKHHDDSECWIVSSVAAPHVGGGDGGLHNAAPPSAPGDGTATGCWWEVPTGGLYALCMHRSAGGSGGSGGEDLLAQPFTTVHWSIPWLHHELYATHPVLRPPCAGGSPTSTTAMLSCLPPASHSSESQERVMEQPSVEWVTQALDDIVRRVGYDFLTAGDATTPHSDCRTDASRESAWTYLRALAHAVWVRVAPHTTGREKSSALPDSAAIGAPHPPPPPIGLLFSGGIDSTILAAVAHYLLPVDVPIELINVAFGDFPEQTPDRIGCVLAMHELLALGSPLLPSHHRGAEVVVDEHHSERKRVWRLVLVDVPLQEAAEAQPHVLNLIYPRTSVMDLNIGTALWFASKGVGVCYTLTSSESKSSSSSSHPASPEATGAMSSSKHLRLGNRQKERNSESSTAALERTCSSSTSSHHAFQALIDVLILEGFDGNGEDGGRVLLSTLGKEYGDVLTPAWRRLGYRKLGQYLNDAACDGVVVFGGGATSKYVSLKRPEDICRAKERVAAGRVASLTPFLADETSTSSSPPLQGSQVLYRAESRVLLLGMGADESLGGYMRYRRTFERDGMEGLTHEMQRDFARLWTRNLGRDDRVVSDHGREGRFPFLAEEVFWALTNIVAPPQDVATTGAATPAGAQEEVRRPLEMRLRDVVDVSLPEGVGDKMILRTCARMLGLTNVSLLQKRAIQFGSRIADRKLQGNAPLQPVLASIGQQQTTATTSLLKFGEHSGQAAAAGVVTADDATNSVINGGASKRSRSE